MDFKCLNLQNLFDSKHFADSIEMIFLHSIRKHLNFLHFSRYFIFLNTYKNSFILTNVI